MKIEVTLYVAGKTFTDVVVVSKFEDCDHVALARNPQAKIISRKHIS